MNPAYVDVNVHPAKLEVRFSNEGQIFKAIYETIKQGLTREDLVRNAIRYEHEGKGFKLEENKASFEYLKPTFHKITLNDRKRENPDNGNTVHNQTEINLEKENTENKPIEETLNQNNEPNNKNDRPAKSKIDEIIEAYRQKYSIDKDDDRINKKTFDEKVDNIKIGTSSDLTLAIGSKRPGDKVAITYIRNGKENKATVSLKDQKGNTSLRSKADLSVSEKIGGEFEILSDRVKVSYGLNSGVIAKNIVDGGELSKIGVVDNYIIMEINGKPVNSQKDIENILKNYKGTVSVVYLDEYGRITRKGFIMP